MATVLLSDLESELIFRKQMFQSLQSERYEKKKKRRLQGKYAYE